LGDSRGDTRKTWFDRAIAAQFDYIPAYDMIYCAWRPRWGGSHEDMYRLGVECLKTGRFDTLVPWQFLTGLKWVTDDSDKSKEYWCRPETFGWLKKLFDGYEKVEKGTPSYYATRSERAAAYWFAGRFKESRQVLEDLGGKLDSGVFANMFRVDSGSAISETYALGGPDAELIRRANSLADSGKASLALPLYQKAILSAAKNPKSLPYLNARLTGAEKSAGFLKGEWVELAPDKDFHGWKTIGGHWRLQPEGGVTVDPEGMTGATLFEQDFGSRLEMRAEIEFHGGTSQYYSGGLILDYPSPEERDNDYAQAILMKTQKSVMLGSRADHRYDDKPGVEIPTKCSLLAKYWDGYCQVFLDDKFVLGGNIRLSRLDSPFEAAYRSGGKHFVGLSSGYWTDGTQVTFRHIQIHRLTSKPGELKSTL